MGENAFDVGACEQDHCLPGLKVSLANVKVNNFGGRKYGSIFANDLCGFKALALAYSQSSFKDCQYVVPCLEFVCLTKGYPSW